MTDHNGIVESRDSTGIVLASEALVEIDLENHFSVMARPHPFKEEVVHCYVQEGESIDHILWGLKKEQLIVRLNGEVVPYSMWQYVKPKAGAIIEIIAFPSGGDNTSKMVLSIVAALAVAALSYGFASGAILGYLGAEGFFVSGAGAALLAASTSILGSLAINALIKPTKPQTNYNSQGVAQPTLSGIGNQAVPFGTVPLVIGEYIIYPNLAAAVFTCVEGAYQYMNLLFDFGMGNMLIDEMKFGDTDISTFGSNVHYQIGAPGANPVLYRYDVNETSISHQYVNAGENVTSITQALCNEIGIDLVFPAGLYAVDKSGNIVNGQVIFQVLYRPYGGNGTWINAANLSHYPGGDSGSPNTNWNRPVNDSASYTGFSSENASFGTGSQAGWIVINATSQNPFSTGVIIYPPLNDSIKIYEVSVTIGASTFTQAIRQAISNWNAPLSGPPYQWIFEPDTTVTVTTGSVSDVELVGPPDGVGQTQVTYLVSGVDYTVNNRTMTFQNQPYGGDGSTVVIGSYAVTNVTARDRVFTAIWSILRSTSYVCPSSIATNKIAMKLRATEELKGNVNQFSARVRQQIPVWDGVNNAGNPLLWPVTATKNPAWIFTWLLTTCPANPRQVPISKIDLVTINTWATYCQAQGLVFSTILDSISTLGQILQDVCAAGLATFTVKDGKYSVVRDVQQTVPVQHFTPRNTWGFSGVRAFPDSIQALRCQFPNPAAAYKQDEFIVYDAGYSAASPNLKYETLKLTGVTDPIAVWKIAMYHLAVSRLRPNEYSWKCDIENLVCQRGDLVKFNHDVVKWGVGAGRITSLTGGITLDDKLVLSAGTYTLRCRTQSGTSVTASATYVSPGVFNGTLTGANIGDLVMVGQTSGTEAVNLIITKIIPGDDFTATITAVDEAPGVYTAFSGAPQTFTSSIATPYTLPPNPPTILGTAVGVSDDNLSVEIDITASAGKQLGY